MVDNDTLNQLNLPSLFQKNPVFHSFITQEITKKVELVTHLVENSKENLIILGPEGVGKSTLISILQAENKNVWINATIKATANLTIESITEKILLLHNHAKYGTHHKQVLLVIDDAINLQPGLINSILAFVLNTTHKVMFLFTNEEYELKCMTDNLLNDCNLIEVSPLTKKQCVDFLQFLSPSAASGYFDSEENKIDLIYAETQGLPGKIIQLLPPTLYKKNSNAELFILMGAVILLIVVALATQWFTDPSIKIELPVIKSSLLERLPTLFK